MRARQSLKIIGRWLWKLIELSAKAIDAAMIGSRNFIVKKEYPPLPF
jgi:hypothetical protein